MKTAGSEGFLTLLPIYVDHILNPLLTDSAFVTEVHHINGDGEDSGVVYSEMQGVECEGETRVNNAMLRSGEISSLFHCEMYQSFDDLH